MNYTKIYNQLIERAKNRKEERGEYYERHHIIPKCLGGSDDKDNLVKLRAKEHFVAHKLLVEIHPDNGKLIHAYWRMANTKNDDRGEYIVGSREYERLRIKLAKQVSILFKGKKLSEETKQKIGKASLGNTSMLGRTHSEETKQKMSEAKLGNTSMLGKKHSEETKQKMSEAKLGRTHITNGTEIKTINPNEELPIGWRYGRKKFNMANNKKWW
jgi:hypothetical protein